MRLTTSGTGMTTDTPGRQSGQPCTRPAYSRLAPVSYTHLDVYKRQGQGHAGAFHFGAQLLELLFHEGGKVGSGLVADLVGVMQE